MAQHFSTTAVKGHLPFFISLQYGLWVDESLNIKPSFKEVVDVFYKAVASKVDFKNKAEEVRIEVNSWAEEKTGGLIKDFFAPGSIDDLTRLVFSNALYFKGDWEKKFDVSKTKEQEFYLLSGRSVQAHFMSTDRWQYLREFDGFKVLELPYRQGGEEEGKPPQRRFSMDIILPVAKDGLPALLDKVCTDNDFLNQHQPYSKVEVGDFKIPRFKFSSNFEASETLKELGLVLPFTSGLPEMVDSPPGDAFKILHKSCIEVNEGGTEAAAVTATQLMGSSRVLNPPKKIDFVADHPFMFFIRDEITRTVLFIGQVLNPLEG
ncbi:serpin-ZX-like [Pyrus x bretschneideri]|uniref:serpin-ZX-like n=1 Tax=Pyrus x bretschneideri TaxID=225117 RepID=UPI00202F1323|nr:serpin-ZX-like [Pyrus x bretschneideri]